MAKHRYAAEKEFGSISLLLPLIMVLLFISLFVVDLGNVIDLVFSVF